jgi:hypothetical protein
MLNQVSADSGIPLRFYPLENRSKALGKVDGERRDQQHDDHGHGSERHESPEENEQPADDLNDNRRPAEKRSEWHAHRVQDGNELIRAASEFGVAVLKKTVADDES